MKSAFASIVVLLAARFAARLSALILMAAPLHAVSPLITDDGDVVPPGEFEIVAWGGFLRDTDTRVVPALLGVTAGLGGGFELGFETGWLWGGKDLSGDSFADTEVATKWRFLGHDDSTWLASAFLAVKLPTASSSAGFGTGKVDTTPGIAATYRLAERSEIDFTAAYTFAEKLSPSSDRDSVFLGIGLRQEVTTAVTLVGEVISELAPNTFSGAVTQVRAGWQIELAPGMFWDAAYGQGIGSASDTRDLFTALRFEF